MKPITKFHFFVVLDRFISGRWDQILDRGVFVATKRFTVDATRRLIAFILALSLAGGLMATPLDDRIKTLQTGLAALQADEPAAFARLKSTLLEANDPTSILLVSGVVTAPLGNISLPVNLIPGPFKPTAIQADFVFPASITFVSATLGPVASGEGKSIQTNVLAGNIVRVIVFGLNQTPITEGLDFTLNIKTTAKGQFPIMMQNPVASDGSGSTLPLCVTSGIVGAS